MIQIPSVRKSTAIHEASHAVVSFLLGVPFLSLALLGDTSGELVPESSLCQTCVAYYEQNDPSTDPHSRRIQDDLRKSAAIAVAGIIGEEGILGQVAGSTEECAIDRELASTRASAVHLWSSVSCHLGLNSSESGICHDCESFLEALRAAVRRIINEPNVCGAVTTLASELETRSRMSAMEVEHLLNTNGLQKGSVLSEALPPAPSSE